VGDSTHLNAIPATIEGFIVKGQPGAEYCQLFFDLTAFGVNVMVSHDFGMGSPIVQLVRGLG